MTEPDAAVVLPGHGVFLPEGACALLQDALRGKEHPVLVNLREAAYRVAMERTARRAGTTAPGNRAPVLPAVAEPCSLQHVPAAGVITVAQAAARLAVTPGRVRQMLRARELDGEHGPRDVWEIDPVSVERKRDGVSGG